MTCESAKIVSDNPAPTRPHPGPTLDLIAHPLGPWSNSLAPRICSPHRAPLTAWPQPGGISIPCDYTSYVSPLSSSKLWNEVKNWRELAKFETPFVVAVHNGFPMAPSKPCFYFK
eukprot:880739-Prymnesium_polylepis.2